MSNKDIFIIGKMIFVSAFFLSLLKGYPFCALAILGSSIAFTLLYWSLEKK